MNPNAAWTVPGYTEVRELGRGASGRVVLSTHEATGMPVAIKYLDDELRADETYLREFRAEARLVAEVDSPNVARLYEYVESDAGAAIVMELVNGVSLRAMLREHGPTEPEAALCVLKGSLLGLAAAHTHNVVHRDYKPENVLVDEVGSSKLADFGIAVRVGRDAVIAGTPAYMAPEQWAGGPASPATDIYAATATFYECLTGKQPYRGDGDLNTLRHQHQHAPIPLEDAPPVLHGLLRSGLAKEAGRRPADALAFLADLESTARFGYGEDWEKRGRGSLARRAALLAALWPLAGSVVGGSALATTVLGMSKLKTLVIASGIAIAVGVGSVGSCIAFTPPPASGGGPVAIGTPISTFPATPTASSSPSASPTPPASISPTPPKTTSQPPPPPPVPPPPTRHQGHRHRRRRWLCAEHWARRCRAGDASRRDLRNGRP